MPLNNKLMITRAEAWPLTKEELNKYRDPTQVRHSYVVNTVIIAKRKSKYLIGVSINRLRRVSW